MGREAALQEQLEDERQIYKYSGAEVQHCDHLLADAGLLSAQLLDLGTAKTGSDNVHCPNWHDCVHLVYKQGKLVSAFEVSCRR